ncbi:MAG: menaquinone biosynthesis decarboxylase [Verrucomicrobiae bacterium]|nr:menaquinone biosynthesis decarboxylase [Verrucomicrobiae bacterium]
MAYASTREWARALESAGELARIPAPVAVELEITEFAGRQMKQPDGGKALLFEKPVLPNGQVSAFPVLINAYGSRRRMAFSMGMEELSPMVGKIAALTKARAPQGWRETLSLLGQAMELRHARPRRVDDGSCKEVIYRAKNGGGLDALPILKCWPRDGGRFVTLPVVVTRDPVTGSVNWGMYRMQIFDAWTTGMHWQMHKTGARHARLYREKGERMPVAVAIGGDPVHAFAATAPLPDGVDESLFAGFLRGQSVELVKCETNDLEVPACADFVIEGYVDPDEMRDEGPFGDHTGFYTPVDRYPVFHVTCINHRRDAVYPCTVVGRPPMEDFYLGDASVRLLLPVIQATFPEIVDLAMPAEGVFHNLVFVSIRKQYPCHAFKIMNGLWGMGQMMFSKIIVVVDEGVDVHRTGDVLFRLGANVDPQRDTVFIRGPSDSLDHAPAEPNVGSHMGLDATAKWASEGFRRAWPEEIHMDSEVAARVDKIISGLSPAVNHAFRK